MKKKLLALVSNPLVSATTLTVAISSVASAQGVVKPSPALVTGYSSLATNLFCPIMNVMFWVLISVSIIMVLWAAFLYVTSEGESEKPSQARKMILYAMIGIVIALIAKGVPSIIGDVFVGAPIVNPNGC